MTYRTDLTYQNGKLSVNPASQPGADIRKPLPEVKGSDLLLSDKYGESLKRETGVADDTLDAIAQTHSMMVKAYNDLMAIRDNQSPEMTQAAHLNSLAQSTDRTVTRMAEQATRMQGRIDERLKSVESEARKSMKFTQRGNAAELRSILRGMGKQQRNETIMAAIEAGDGELMAAIFDGVHPLQVGMDTANHKNMYDVAWNKHAPDLLKLRRGLEKGRELVRETFTDLLERSDVISAREIREEYEAQKRKAKEAAAKINSVA